MGEKKKWGQARTESSSVSTTRAMVPSPIYSWRANLPARHGAAKRRERFATRVGNKELKKTKGKGEALAALGDETNRRSQKI
jgi:hypothetical protein